MTQSVTINTVLSKLADVLNNTKGVEAREGRITRAKVVLPEDYSGAMDAESLVGQKVEKTFPMRESPEMSPDDINMTHLARQVESSIGKMVDSLEDPNLWYRRTSVLDSFIESSAKSLVPYVLEILEIISVSVEEFTEFFSANHIRVFHTDLWKDEICLECVDMLIESLKCTSPDHASSRVTVSALKKLSILKDFMSSLNQTYIRLLCDGVEGGQCPAQEASGAVEHFMQELSDSEVWLKQSLNNVK